MFAQWDPLARHVANNLWGKPWIRRIGTFKDVLQEARIGLLKAIDGFNPEKSGAATFMTYAHACIQRHVERRAQSAGVVRFPIQQQVDGFVPPAIRQLPETFDQEVPGHDDLSRAEVEMVQKVQEAVEQLNDPYRKVMVARWGLFATEPRTYEEIAVDLKSTAFLVRELERIATRDVLRYVMRKATPKAEQATTGELFDAASSGRREGFWRRKSKKSRVTKVQPVMF